MLTFASLGQVRSSIAVGGGRGVRLVAICALAVGAATARAEVVPWLYDADMKVSSQTDGDRRRAAGAALGEILTRLTGMREVPMNPRIDAAFEQPERYYVRYGFTSRHVDGHEPSDEPVLETRFEIRFEPDALLRLLRSAGLPIWSADRPRVLAWVVVADGGRREIVSATATGSLGRIAAALGDEARRRGIQLSLPLMDLEDRRVLPADLLGRFWQAVDAASFRYGPDLVLVGRMVAGDDGRWVSDWQLRPSVVANPGPAAEFEHAAATAASAAGEAVHRLADTLAERYAVRGGDLGAIRLIVRGAQTVRGYASLLQHLQSREYIDRVDVSGVEPDILELRLHSRSSRDQLLELLLMGGSLAPSGAGGERSTLPRAEFDLTWTGPR